MLGWIDSVPRRPTFEVRRTDGFVDQALGVRGVQKTPRAHQQAAAFMWRVLSSVLGDLLQNRRPDVNPLELGGDQPTSTISAVPIPPPTQSEAAPRPPPRAWSVCTSVVRRRAPLAPIG